MLWRYIADAMHPKDTYYLRRGVRFNHYGTVDFKDEDAPKTSFELCKDCATEIRAYLMIPNKKNKKKRG